MLHFLFLRDHYFVHRVFLQSTTQRDSVIYFFVGYLVSTHLPTHSYKVFCKYVPGWMPLESRVFLHPSPLIFCHNLALWIRQLLGFFSFFCLEEDSQEMDQSSVKCETLAVVQGLSFAQTVSSLREVQRLDSLVQAHTLLAVMADRNSSEHQFNLLRAYDFVLQIWQVSMLGRDGVYWYKAF